MKTRIHNWFDTKNRVPLYSFQVYHNDQWMNPMENGKPLFFKTSEERDIARAEARKKRA